LILNKSKQIDVVTQFSKCAVFNKSTLAFEDQNHPDISESVIYLPYHFLKTLSRIYLQDSICQYLLNLIIRIVVVQWWMKVWL